MICNVADNSWTTIMHKTLPPSKEKIEQTIRGALLYTGQSEPSPFSITTTAKLSARNVLATNPLVNAL